MKKQKKDNKLSYDERVLIEKFLKEGHSLKAIGIYFEKSETLIANEVKRGRPQQSQSYQAAYAQKLADQPYHRTRPNDLERGKTRALELYQQGKSTGAIFAQLQLELGELAPGQSTLYRWLKNFRSTQAPSEEQK